MSIQMILFDLDGTLLPMDQDVFVKAYFGALARKLAPIGYDPKTLIGAVWSGTEAMIQNTGEKTNEAVFWDRFAQLFGENAREDLPYFDEFYQESFDSVKDSCGYDPRAAETVRALKQMGFRLALATNPIFPAIATEKRMIWAGLDKQDFELYTTYENSRFCKPNPDYYRDILRSLHVAPEHCLMVGNDVGDDMVAKSLGMEVFLLTDCLINKQEADLSIYPSGSFSELLTFIQERK